MQLPRLLTLPKGTLDYYSRLGKRVLNLMKPALGGMIVESLVILGTFVVALIATQQADRSAVYALIALGAFVGYIVLHSLVSAPVELDNEGKDREARIENAREAAVTESAVAVATLSAEKKTIEDEVARYQRRLRGFLPDVRNLIEGGSDLISELEMMHPERAERKGLGPEYFHDHLTTYGRTVARVLKDEGFEGQAAEIEAMARPGAAARMNREEVIAQVIAIRDKLQEQLRWGQFYNPFI